MKSILSNGVSRPYFINHNAKETSWEDPRPKLVAPGDAPNGGGGGGGVASPAPANVVVGRPVVAVAEQPRSIVAQPFVASRVSIQPQPQPFFQFQQQPFQQPLQQPLQQQQPPQKDFTVYKDLLKSALEDKKTITPDEDRLLTALREKLKISDDEHAKLLKEIGISQDDYDKARDFESQEGVNTCVVCMDAAASHIILDCMHMCLCPGCAASFLQKRQKHCPKCRSDIRDIRKTF